MHLSLSPAFAEIIMEITHPQSRKLGASHGTCLETLLPNTAVVLNQD